MADRGTLHQAEQSGGRQAMLEYIKMATQTICRKSHEAVGEPRIWHGNRRTPSDDQGGL